MSLVNGISLPIVGYTVCKGMPSGLLGNDQFRFAARVDAIGRAEYLARSSETVRRAVVTLVYDWAKLNPFLGRKGGEL